MYFIRHILPSTYHFYWWWPPPFRIMRVRSKCEQKKISGPQESVIGSLVIRAWLRFSVKFKRIWLVQPLHETILTTCIAFFLQKSYMVFLLCKIHSTPRTVVRIFLGRGCVSHETYILYKISATIVKIELPTLAMSYRTFWQQYTSFWHENKGFSFFLIDGDPQVVPT